MSTTVQDLDLGKYKLGWADDVDDYVFTPKRGLTKEIVQEMSWMKGEPDWMLKFRLRALEVFHKKPMPNWGGDMSQIFFDDIYYYVKPMEGQVTRGMRFPKRSARPTRSWVSRRPSRSISPASLRSTSLKWCSTATAKTSKRRVSSSATWTPLFASIPRS